MFCLCLGGTGHAQGVNFFFQTWSCGISNQSGMPGRVAQSVTCLATDACLTADQGVASSIPAQM